MKRTSLIPFYLFLFLLINVTAVAQIPTAATKAIPTQDISNVDKSIQSLSDSKDQAARKADQWNRWYIGTVALAAIVAFLVFFAQAKAISKGRELSKAQDDLMAEKDRKATEDSQDKELKIQELRRENLALEKALSPRILTMEQQRDIAKSLKEFGGTEAVIEYFPDWECRGLAEQIAAVLQVAHWKFPAPKFNPNKGWIEGVDICHGFGSNPQEVSVEKIARYKEISARLGAALSAAGITVPIKPGGDPTLPYGTISIWVGLKYDAKNPWGMRWPGPSNDVILKIGEDPQK